MNEIKIYLNNKVVNAYKGESILQVANKEGIEIPTLCHDPRLKPFSSCYVCVVKVDNSEVLKPACSSIVNEGMKIETEGSEIYKARQSALNLLLSNHYADCLPPCKLNCPAGVDVQSYISLIEKGLYIEAIKVIKDTNPLPAICGRVCVRPCEVVCNRNFLDEGAAVGVDYMKRYIADKDLFSDESYKPKVETNTNKKIAIIGAGPGGLSAAYFLQQKGHQCDIYEAAPNAGGWLRYGIPDYRLPNDIIDKEIEKITELGVKIFLNQKLGENLLFKDLKNQYDSVIISIGSQKSTLAGIKGEESGNVFSGIEFLRNMALTGKKPDFLNKKIIVVGGGNTAMDCCRTAVRCNASDVTVIYRRTEKEMPANPIEIHESKVEGVNYLFLTNPKEIKTDSNGNLKSVVCVKMKLGEPDKSGRRSPIEIENSEFEIEADILLSAIGQKTEVEFLNDVNSCFNENLLELDKWGNIKTNPKTFETSIQGIFAIGDCVTGPATIIEAIAHAKTASKHCHSFLTGESVETKIDFLSKKNNFRDFKKNDFVGKFLIKPRNEMPVLDKENRKNFDEVELGYTNEELVKNETSRCLECGCSAFYFCELKKLASQYNANQSMYKGEFNEYEVDFSHPLIEFDQNKCILCGKCIRICKEIVGAEALGFVKRGFNTYVAPSMELPLNETKCESCGMCITVCPTAAISENKTFKPLALQNEKFTTNCNFCSLACSLEVQYVNNFIYDVNGFKGLTNYDTSICGKGKFGYNIFNKKERITQPLFKENNQFNPITWQHALEIIIEKLKKSNADETAFFTGSGLTNEELYLINKLMKTAVQSNNISSFNYLENEDVYLSNTDFNIPITEIKSSDYIVFFGSEINEENPVVGFEANKAKNTNNAIIEVITTLENSKMKAKYNNNLKILDYYFFIKAANYYIVNNNLYNKDLQTNTNRFTEYKKELLKSDFSLMLKKAGVNEKEIQNFINNFLNHEKSVLIFSENNLSVSASQEVLHFAKLISHYQNKKGIIALKNNFNSVGLNKLGISKKQSNLNFNNKLKKLWNIAELPKNNNLSVKEEMLNGNVKNLFIFQEDPLGCSTDKEQTSKLFNNKDFILVQDYFLTPTAMKADLVLPAEFNFEKNGSIFNTFNQKISFNKKINSKIEVSNLELFNKIFESFGLKIYENIEELNKEIDILLNTGNDNFSFITNLDSSSTPKYKYSCNSLYKLLDDEIFGKLKTNY